jgi:hypothetical protein
MDLQPYVDAVRHDLGVAAAAGGAEAQALADRLTAPLESAIRLALLEALAEAAEQITSQLAPGLVDVRLRGRDPEFVVTAAPDHDQEALTTLTAGEDDGGTWRVTLRLPEQLKSTVESTARDTGVSVNTWLVRAVHGALGRGTSRGAKPRPDSSFSGWVR